ncbi:MAG TPA: hypothetical protein VHL57_02545, partial [Flavobacteriales bacterium]|nr:hypothetical protein [Flavobacteriales bacterium]
MGKAEWSGSCVFAVLLGLLAFAPARKGAGADAPRPAWSYPQVKRDLKQIRLDTLRVLVLRDPLSYEARPGAVTGVEWELLERFAKQEHIPLKAVPVDVPDSMLALLQRGAGDVIAAQLCPLGWAAPYVAFTQAYRRVAPVRMALRPDPLLPKGRLSADTSGLVHISWWSPFLGVNGQPLLEDSTLKVVVDSVLPEEVVVRTAIGRY